MPLAEILARQAHAAEEGQSPQHDISLIILFLKGGLSTIDTWDLKPEAPAEFRGPFQSIETKVPGIRIGEHLPLCAGQMDKFSLVRSFGHRNSDHGPADHYMLTGYHPLAGFNPTLSPNNQRPSHGSIVAKKLGPRGSVPPYVCLPRLHARRRRSVPGGGHRSVRCRGRSELTQLLGPRSDALRWRFDPMARGPQELRDEIDRFQQNQARRRETRNAAGGQHVPEEGLRADDFGGGTGQLSASAKNPTSCVKLMGRN